MLTSTERLVVRTRYIPATMNQISKAIYVSEIRLSPSVVSSATAMTLTMAECLIRDMRRPVKGGQAQHACPETVNAEDWR